MSGPGSEAALGCGADMEKPALGSSWSLWESLWLESGRGEENTLIRDRRTIKFKYHNVQFVRKAVHEEPWQLWT